ncbi:hypothetical protein GCM10023169_34700 [Georgenia halophila]|uniref:Methyltransferase domain-containing protein n=1 Tax=Georgenia halophila TaxID=620889 RepID=A0ABP8LJE0_9MICO
MTGSSADADWSEYYRRTAGRPPRDLVRKGELTVGGAGVAVDLGCGDGTETVWLLEQGWQVTAVDREPAAVAGVADQTRDGALTGVVADLCTYEFPTADLVFACASLPFVPGGVRRRVGEGRHRRPGWRRPRRQPLRSAGLLGRRPDGGRGDDLPRP